MSDCLPRTFDVTQLVPVSARVMAADEAEAQRIALVAPHALLVPAKDRSVGLLTMSVGFPQEITVNEVVTN